MNDDPCEVKVLYAKIVDSDKSLQTLVESIVEYFAKDGNDWKFYTKKIRDT